jgi:hypothetical protein
MASADTCATYAALDLSSMVMSVAEVRPSPRTSWSSLRRKPESSGVTKTIIPAIAG